MICSTHRLIHTCWSSGKLEKNKTTVRLINGIEQAELRAELLQSLQSIAWKSQFNNQKLKHLSKLECKECLKIVMQIDFVTLIVDHSFFKLQWSYVAEVSMYRIRIGYPAGCRILALFSDQDWIWIFIFEKNWIRTGPGYLFNFSNEISLTVI